jgi:hypothetical protein
MTDESAKLHVQIKYVYEYEKMAAIFRELYEEAEGCSPDITCDLLAWFFNRFEYDCTFDHWQPKLPVLH